MYSSVLLTRPSEFQHVTVTLNRTGYTAPVPCRPHSLRLLWQTLGLLKCPEAGSWVPFLLGLVEIWCLEMLFEISLGTLRKAVNTPFSYLKLLLLDPCWSLVARPMKGEEMQQASALKHNKQLQILDQVSWKKIGGKGKDVWIFCAIIWSSVKNSDLLNNDWNLSPTLS